MKFTPWMIKERSAREEHDGPQEKEHKTSVEIEINKEIELEVKLPPRSVDPTTCRVYITKVVIETFGGTEGCLGCTTPCSAEKASLTASSAGRGWRSTFGGIRQGKMVYRDQENARIREQVRAQKEGRGAQGEVA